jgi:hypothetical protein
MRQGITQIKEKDTSVDELEQFHLLSSKLKDVREKDHWATEERKRMLMVKDVCDGNVNSNVTWNEKLKKLDANYDLVIAAEKKRLLKAKFVIAELQKTLSDFADINSTSKKSHMKLVEEMGSIDKRSDHLRNVFSKFDSVVLDGSLDKEEGNEIDPTVRIHQETDLLHFRRTGCAQQTVEGSRENQVEEDIVVVQNYLRFVERTGITKDGLKEEKFQRFLKKQKENKELKVGNRMMAGKAISAEVLSRTAAREEAAPRPPESQGTRNPKARFGREDNRRSARESKIRVQSSDQTADGDR